MNPYQMALQLKKELQAVVWPSGAGDVVFGTHKGVVAVFAGAPTENQFSPRWPCCLVMMGDGEMDEDNPGLVEHTFQLIVGVSATGAPLGSHAIVGGPSRDLGKSPNRGAAEVLSRVRSAVQDLTGADGAAMQVVGESLTAPFLVGSLRHVAFATLDVKAWCTTDLFYAVPQELNFTGTTWTWEGAHCSDRFDFLTYVLRRGPDSTEIADPTAGTAVYTGIPATTEHTAVGNQRYQCFALYDARGDGTSDGNSEPSIVGSFLDNLA